VPNLKSLKWRLTRTLAVTTAGVSAFKGTKSKDKRAGSKEQRAKTKGKS